MKPIMGTNKVFEELIQESIIQEDILNLQKIQKAAYQEGYKAGFADGKKEDKESQLLEDDEFNPGMAPNKI